MHKITADIYFVTMQGISLLFLAIVLEKSQLLPCILFSLALLGVWKAGFSISFNLLSSTVFNNLVV